MVEPTSRYVDSVTIPMHALLTLAALSLFFICILPSSESIDAVATVDVFTSTVFPSIVPNAKVLGWIRIGFGLLSSSVTAIQFINEGPTVVIPYHPESKLKALPIKLGGFKSQSTFTCWCWILLGISFWMNGIIALLSTQQSYAELFSSNTNYRWILRIALICFEIAAPLTLLVAAIVTYVIWPQNLSQKKETTTLKKPTALIQHNMNVIMALVEVGLLGGLPVRIDHIAFVSLFGIVYVLFLWFVMIDRWTDEPNNPQIMYHFLDPTLGKGRETIAIFGLLMVLILSFSVFYVWHEIMAHMGGGPMASLLGIALLSCLVCRVRD